MEKEPEGAQVITISTFMTLLELQRYYMLIILKEEGWNRTYAAKRLGISLRCLRNHLREIESPDYKIPQPCMKRIYRVYRDRQVTPQDDPFSFV